MTLLYAILLLLLGLILIIVELLVPSGGLISIMALITLFGAVYCAFKVGTTIGVLFIVLSLICIPVIIVTGLHYIPKTKFGRRLCLIKTPQKNRAGIEKAPHADQTDFTKLLGQKTVALTPLRPCGIVEIDNQRYSVTAWGEMLDKGTPVIVTRIEGNNIIVEKLES